MHKELKKILWRYPSEQFAYMAQRVLEVKIPELVKNVTVKTSRKNVALAGGVFSNIKMNMRIRDLPGVEDCFIFPQMGDGGLALGAAMSANHKLNRVANYEFNDVFLGLDYKDEEVEKTLKRYNLHFEEMDNIAYETASLIAKNEIVFWFQGRMEYGPRALGHRSILALPNSEQLKDQLNLKLKMRVWYQPFCPSMLEVEAKKNLEGYDNPNPFMSMGYRVKKEKRDELEGVISVDGTCRPQVIKDDKSQFGKLLTHLKKITGKGIVLNTSFNVHGDPMVCSPEDAVKTFIKTNNKYMAIHKYLVTRENHIKLGQPG